MLRDGKIVIDLAYVLVPFKFLFLTISRAIAWAVALTMVGALVMRVLGGFGYSRRPLRFGSDGEEYTYSSITVRERPRWGARLLGWTTSRVVTYVSDYYDRWFAPDGSKATKSKQLQRTYDMFVIRRELKKDTGFVVDREGERSTATPEKKQVQQYEFMSDCHQAGHPIVVAPPRKRTPHQKYARNRS